MGSCCGRGDRRCVASPIADAEGTVAKTHLGCLLPLAGVDIRKR